MSEAENIAVLPKLAGARFNKRPAKTATVEEVVNVDPDVDYILKGKKKGGVDVLNMKHTPTAEELAEGSKNPEKVTSSWNWLVITLAVIVFILIVVIVWYVLKQNSSNEDTVDVTKMRLPPSVVMPNAMPNLRAPQNPYSQTPQHQLPKMHLL